MQVMALASVGKTMALLRDIKYLLSRWWVWFILAEAAGLAFDIVVGVKLKAIRVPYIATAIASFCYICWCYASSSRAKEGESYTSSHCGASIGEPIVSLSNAREQCYVPKDDSRRVNKSQEEVPT